MINSNRIRLLKKGEKKGTVVYWMSRDQRARDNWALLFAKQLADEQNAGLAAVFTLVPEFLDASYRQYAFMLKGLVQTEAELLRHNIPLVLLSGAPELTLPYFIAEKNIACVVTDFDPLKIKRMWKRDVVKKTNITFYEVDAHNIVPCLYVSNKEEYGAYTLRPKIHRLLPEFLDEFPPLEPMKKNAGIEPTGVNFDEIAKTLKIDFNVAETGQCAAGEAAAAEKLELFLEKGLTAYNEERNNPALGGQSGLSPWLHFGHIAPQRAALEVKKRFPQNGSAEAFLEELIVRRELADNFCYYNTAYDSFDGFKDWAKETLNKHKADKREYVYSPARFENAETHEDLWNAAQNELLYKGKIHGYMRMYWAKKILEWSETPEEALNTAIYLNDKYSLDGRDPNGYAGCAWSVGGIHDRAWAERPVFGKIRYMNYNGCKRKFDVAEYIKLNKKKN